ncbi:hypothetical protein [Paenibacillus sp. YYML68]|uniref:hypothetical protein n=1 Tax=Paenibacillus sp. YYML68 TaxID=2909250 RepID=UPI0024909112|nr:hypothetical protein [Paenibacillus sp. YYML68]
MLWLIIAGSIVGPWLMVLLRRCRPQAALVFDWLALAALYGFGLSSAAAVYTIRVNHTVMMTEVHRIFYDPVFLASAAYFGLYVLYAAWWSLTAAVPMRYFPDAVVKLTFGRKAEKER